MDRPYLKNSISQQTSATVTLIFDQDERVIMFVYLKTLCKTSIGLTVPFKRMILGSLTQQIILLSNPRAISIQYVQTYFEP